MPADPNPIPFDDVEITRDERETFEGFVASLTPADVEAERYPAPTAAERFGSREHYETMRAHDFVAAEWWNLFHRSEGMLDRAVLLQAALRKHEAWVDDVVAARRRESSRRGHAA